MRSSPRIRNIVIWLSQPSASCTRRTPTACGNDRLPAYSFMLGLLALLGFMAIAAGVDKLPEFAQGFAFGAAMTGAEFGKKLVAQFGR